MKDRLRLCETSNGFRRSLYIKCDQRFNTSMFNALNKQNFKSQRLFVSILLTELIARNGFLKISYPKHYPSRSYVVINISVIWGYSITCQSNTCLAFELNKKIFKYVRCINTYSTLPGTRSSCLTSFLTSVFGRDVLQNVVYRSAL